MRAGIRHMRVAGRGRHDGKSTVQRPYELRQPCIGRFLAANALQAHFLDQAILQRLVCRSTRPLACGLLA
jgi:hypothetical protein